MCLAIKRDGDPCSQRGSKKLDGFCMYHIDWREKGGKVRGESESLPTASTETTRNEFTTLTLSITYPSDKAIPIELLNQLSVFGSITISSRPGITQKREKSKASEEVASTAPVMQGSG
jgi:hypothetical protein